MSNVAKLSLAVVLALAAAGLNAVWLSAEKHPDEFVTSAVDVPAGEIITDEMLQAVPVPGDFDQLRASLIPFQNRAILLGLKASRDYVKGDVFFQRDLKAPQELAEFEVLGPFKLISVGSRFTQASAKQSEDQLDSSGNTITIAVSADFDERTRRLLQIVDPNQAQSPLHEPSRRIIAVQVVPKEEQVTAPAANGKNVVYQTVQLEGIANVPSVLLEGDLIRFVVPAHGAR
jgi:hypothetical protein